MKNIFTNYLLDNGWLEVALMSYKKAENNLEIFFDNSNQIEIYKGNSRIKDVYLHELKDLINVISEC